MFDVERFFRISLLYLRDTPNTRRLRASIRPAPERREIPHCGPNLAERVRRASPRVSETLKKQEVLHATARAHRVPARGHGTREERGVRPPLRSCRVSGLPARSRLDAGPALRCP